MPSQYKKLMTYTPSSCVQVIKFLEAFNFKLVGKIEQGLTYMWALGKSASVFLSLPKNKAVRMTANVNSVIFPKPQVVTIKVDGQIIGSWTLSNRWQWQEPNIIIEPSEKRPDVSIIEFLFSQQLMQKNDQRPLAVLFESITLDEQ